VSLKTTPQSLSSTLPIETDPITSLSLDKPYSLGIKISTNLPEKITNNKVYIFAANPDRAEQLIAIINDFPNLWEDTGTINIPESEIIKVLLVEGWQKHNVSSRAYLLSRKDK